MKILVVTGGSSSERKISLLSAKEVYTALKSIGHQAHLYDLKLGLKELERKLKDFDLVFPVLHGEEGEGGNLQKFLTNKSVNFVGGEWKGFKQGWYKMPFKKYCDENKIATAEWKMVKRSEDIKKFGFPSVFKSSNGGSSRGVIILKSDIDLKKKDCQEILNSGNGLFVERYLPGIEITVGILDNQALPVIEIVPPDSGWFDYKNKYSGETQEIIDAPSLDEKTKKEAQKIALKIHKALNLGAYSRIDFIISKNLPYVLEVNTIPGLTSESLFPKSAKAFGLTFPNLIKKLVELSLAK